MTINLQQAKKLHELGVRKKRGESHWFIRGSYDVDFRLWHGKDCPCDKNHLPAYSAEELLKMNRSTMIITITVVHIAIQSDKNDENQYFEIESGTTLTEALCNKLIYDLENGIVSLEEVNK